MESVEISTHHLPNVGDFAWRQVSNSSITERFVTFHNAGWNASLFVSLGHFNEESMENNVELKLQAVLNRLSHTQARREGCSLPNST